MNNNASKDSNALKPALGAIRVSGAERNDFLQGQLTNDLGSLQPDKPLLAGWANAKGRLFCVTWVLDWQEATWLIMPAELCTNVARRLGMFVLRADAQVEVSDLSAIPASREAAGELIETKESLTSDCFYSDNYYYFEPAAKLGIILGNHPGESDLTNWRLGCIKAGLPSVWASTSESYVPQMLNMDLLNGISFSKGCYVGQEIVARTQNLGRIKRRMYRYRVNEGTAPIAGATVQCDDRGAGTVVDAIATDGVDGADMLIVMRIESLADPLSLEDGRKLEQETLPYEVPESV